MINSPLEYLAAKYDNVVRYDQNGDPSVFVRFPKMKSSDLSEGLPNHTHPAFITDGQEYDYLLLGKYKAAENREEEGPILSVPYVKPASSMESSEMIGRIRQAGSAFSCMTVADYGFVKLLAQKHGWNPSGNNAGGSAIMTGYPWLNFRGNTQNWPEDQESNVGSLYTYKGWVYRCIKKAIMNSDHTPDKTPDCYRREKFIGGIVKDLNPSGYSYNPGSLNPFGAGLPMFHTLNGTGPKQWYLNNDVSLMADLIGNVLELQAGYMIHNGELLIMENNDAASPNAVLDYRSSKWKAILPNASDDGYTLVQPGTTGTLHWNWDAEDQKLYLDTICESLSPSSVPADYFDYSRPLIGHPTRLPHIPSIVKELGLFPVNAEENFDEPEFWDFTGYKVVYRGASACDLNHRVPMLDRLLIANDNGTFEYGCRPRCLS